MKKKFKKQIMALALSLIMLIGIMPMSAFAVAYNTYDVSGRTQSGNNTAFIRYGLTDDAAGSFSVIDQRTSVQLNLTLKNGWYLEKWDTWFYGAYDKAGASDPECKGSNPNFDDRYTFFNIDQTALPTNVNYITVRFLGSLYGDFRIDAVVRPILTVNAGDGVSYQMSTEKPISVESGVAVEYGKNASVTYSVDEKHVVTGISANYGTQYSENGSGITVSSIVRPATVNISTRLKQQNVIFDANGGEGTMAAQTFEHSVEQALSANSFTKTGYIFAGWNTVADGSGIDYADRETVTFTPETDGDSITLYAQWTQCTDHSWEDGKCTECGALCSHFDVDYDSSENKIVETCTAGCGHTATADLVLDHNVSTVYTGSVIEALKVTYSDNWQGDNLDIVYSNNIDAGTASGLISIDGVNATQTFEIKKAPLTIAANSHHIKYGEAPANDGVTYSGFVANETASVLGGTLGFDYNYSNGDGIGTYEITPKGLASNNYDITFVKGTLTVDKADATCAPPTANNPTYTGGMQELVTAATVNGGTMVFSFDKEGGYFPTLSAEKAGNYTVWYKVLGDDNHNDSVPASIDVEIKRATPDIGTVSVNGTVYDTTAPKDVVLVCSNTEVPGKLSIEKAGDYMCADKSEYYWEFVPEDTDNYEVINGYIEIDVVDTAAPTASVSIDDHKWTFWHAITFGLFYNEGKEVTITYADNENGSGLKDMLYYVADKGMSADELKDVQWTAYSEAFDLDPDGRYVVYAKAVDNDGNTVIINSDGYVLDKTQAVVQGLTNGGTYYGQLVFNVADKLAGVKYVLIDGYDKTSFEGQYVINGDNTEHTVTVMDNAGNMTEYTVTVYKNYTVTHKADSETVSTETVGHDRDAVYTENSATVPGVLQSPQTGDNSNMALWIALLFLSGGAVITLTVIRRKKRTVNRWLRLKIK